MQYLSKKRTAIAVLTGFLAASGLSALADEPVSTTTAGQDMKDAAHSTASAAKKTGHKIKNGVKKGVHKSAEKVNEGADKVKAKTQPE